MDDGQQKNQEALVPPTPAAVPVKLARPWQATVVAYGMLILGGLVEVNAVGLTITYLLYSPDYHILVLNPIVAVVSQPIAVFAFILARQLLRLVPSARQHALTFSIIILTLAFAIAACVFGITKDALTFILAMISIGILFGTPCVLLTRPEVTRAYDRQPRNTGP